MQTTRYTAGMRTLSPAITQVALTAWTSHHSFAACAHCDWTMSDESDRRTTSKAQAHVSSNPGHIVAIDRGQTRYAKSAGA